MSEWWTYRLSDFLMFSPEIYWRLVARYNREVWPLQLAALVAGCVLLWLATAPRAGTQRIAAAVLAIAWLWIGWAFHWQRYATINWAAQDLTGAFGVEAVLLFASALFDGSHEVVQRNAPSGRVGWIAAGCGVLLYPLVGLLFGRPLAQAEVFGLMPDPTALATLGLLFALHVRYRLWLAIIPALSLLAGWLTLWTMAH